ncbi:BTB/POZ domain-containing protein kctd15-like isoform X2 [Branchiostoma floridae]|uniref:BTB/POZ domain-containing protein kctd15-like isoform X2 n=1 Tax=Branchiostoma floridae TaxID=7739 RepID=A0A9J7HTI8_BRAFL|nr:BTB/POZ domain-containing protein kctd15-like isoform X2 [Branchiostoma floridae]
MSKFDSVVSLNVGGHIYTTARSTLTRFRDSMLGAMFGGDFDALRDDQGRYFIDRNGRLFQHVLNFLRTSQLVLPEDFKELPLLEMEADFYQIQPLIESLQTHKARLETGPCDVVVLNLRSGCLSFGASSAKVKDVVNGLQTCRYNCYGDDNITALLGRLQDTGFTVQSHNTVRNQSAPTLTDKWVLVRKTARASSDSK